MTTEREEKEKSLSDSTKLSRPLYSPPPSNAGNAMFWAAVCLSQVVGVACIVLVIYWSKLYGGFSWNKDPNLQFFYHPVLMVLGLIFFYGDAILVYRVLHFLPKWILKIIHAACHICAIACSSIALVAVFENHRRTNKADLYSLHSWIGLGTFIFFCIQYLGSFVTFLFPTLPVTWRMKIMPFHTFFGVGLFILAVGTAQMGITERLLWTTNYTIGEKSPSAVVGNSLGLALVVFAFLVVFLTTHGAYKRRPLPEEVTISMN